MGWAVRAPPHVKGFQQERGHVWFALLETPRCGIPAPEQTEGRPRQSRQKMMQGLGWRGGE